MTRAELIAKLVQKYQSIERNKVDQGVRLIIDFLAQSLAQGERVELRNFGCFEIKQREARNGYNPRTGERMVVASRKCVRFKASQALKGRVNSKLA